MYSCRRSWTESTTSGAKGFSKVKKSSSLPSVVACLRPRLFIKSPRGTFFSEDALLSKSVSSNQQPFFGALWTIVSFIIV